MISKKVYGVDIFHNQLNGDLLISFYEHGELWLLADLSFNEKLAIISYFENPDSEYRIEGKELILSDAGYAPLRFEMTMC